MIMMKTTNSTKRVAPRAAVAALLAALLAAPGLMGSVAVGQEEAAAGPCAEYAAKLCEKADPASCQAIEMATELMPPAACEAGLKDLEYSFAKLTELKKQCTELGDKLCADLGEDTETCKLVRSKIPELAPEQCKQMMGQYANVLADLQRQEAANKPLSAEDQKAVATGTDAAFGPADAKVTVVEFSDFQCPYCTRAAAVANQIKEKYPDRVRFVFRQFPLSFHKEAHLAAQAALAAGAQGKFWEYHDLLFENQKALDRASLEKYGEQLGLDMAEFKKALDDGTYKDEVDADIELGNKVAVSGTPTMFINGTRVQNATDFASVSAQIDAALQ
jgi:protein-disulfide isomerase